MKHFVLISAAMLLFCVSLYAGVPIGNGDECAACQMMKMIRPGSPFFELAKSMHQQNSNALLDQHWFCDYVWYYDPSGSDFLKWEQLASSKWAVKFSPACVCTVWSVNIYFNLKKTSPAGKGDTLDIFVHEAVSPYTQIFKQFFLINSFNPESQFLVYPPLNAPYSVGSPIINTKRDFLVAFKMRGPSSDSVQWYFKTPAINALRSLKFITNTSTQTASVALGQSVDIKLEAELCTHIPLPCTIPVELSLFSAQAHSQGVKLYWETATETNNYGFQLLRKITQNGEWEKHEFIAGKGYSTTKQQYNFNDLFDIQSLMQKGHEHIWYKLIQIDYDGTINELPPIMVQLFDGIPDQFELEQNYPNPVSAVSSFGLSTSIRYRLPYAHHITLTIYDALGREIQTLVNEEKPAGIHQILWNAKDLPGGTYLIKLDAGLNSMIKKMLLVK